MSFLEFLGDRRQKRVYLVGPAALDMEGYEVLHQHKGQQSLRVLLLSVSQCELGTEGRTRLEVQKIFFFSFF